MPSSSKSAKKKSSSKKKTPKKKPASAPVAYLPSEKEAQNGQKVLNILEKIEDIGYTVERADLFTVVEPELNLEIHIDAEEEAICLVAEICEVTHLENYVADWPIKLLELNNSLLHGAFTLYQGKIFLRENLAAENLDRNELEEALSAMFAAIIRYAEALKLL